ncbi:hypothetical protein [Calothrix sp. CCY 0018]|uniref:hypothetical protein n=1 Tax=Calothrix sp. CCY 0018 TaxID=3103864 RepID=UPI0039C7094C
MKNTWRLKPRLYKQNPFGLKKLLVHGGGLRLCSSGFNRQTITNYQLPIPNPQFPIPNTAQSELCLNFA